MNNAKAKTKIKKLDAFWERGARMANQTRKKIFPSSHFSMEESELPQDTTENESVLLYRPYPKNNQESYARFIRNSSNTDLKLAYGVGISKVLCEYDENFNHFLLALTISASCPHWKPVFIRRGAYFCLPSNYFTAHKNDRLHQSCRLLYICI